MKLDDIKVDVKLIEGKLNVTKMHTWLQKGGISKDSYDLKLMQELGELSKYGRNRGKPSTYGFCWLNNVSLKKLSIFGPGLWTWGAEKIAINVYQEDIEDQTYLYIDHDLINVAYRMKAVIEIVDFKIKK